MVPSSHRVSSSRKARPKACCSTHCSQVFALIGPGGPPEKITQLSQALGRLGIACFQVLPKAAHVSNDLAGLIDITGDFGRLYGARGEFLYLIRPDGYAGLFQRPIDARALRSYLTKLFMADALEAAFAATELGAPLKEVTLYTVNGHTFRFCHRVHRG